MRKASISMDVDESCDFCERRGKSIYLFDGCDEGIVICATCLRKALKLIEEESDD